MLYQKSNRPRAGWVPKSLAVGAVAALAVGLGGGFAQGAAQKVPLTTANIDCNGGSASGQGTGPGTGFVVYNTTGSGKVIANVVLQDARADTTYSVRLIQSSGECSQVDGYITTDAGGDGSTNVQQPDSGATAFVAVNNTGNPAADYFTTQVVPT